MKQKQTKISMVTAYDFPSAKQVEAAGIDMILVGDSCWGFTWYDCIRL